MNCPFCEKEMVSGVVRCGKHMYFTTSPRSFFLVPGEEDVGIATSVDDVTAWHCAGCKKLVLDYSAVWQEVYGQQ